MVPLILFIALGLFILVAFEVKARQQSKQETVEAASDAASDDGECCGQHLVCERESLLATKPEIVYYDDEELDRLSGVEINAMNEADKEAIRDVFHTLQEKDVAGWARSMQMRNIQLPEDVREEALLIVRERRNR